MKTILRRLLPDGLVRLLQLIRLDLSGLRRFNSNYAREDDDKIRSAETWIMFYTHQIEKGLSHSNFRYGFGRKPLSRISVLLLKIQELDPDYHANFYYLNAISALNEYIRRHKAAKYDISFLKDIFSESQISEFISSCVSHAGSEECSSLTKRNNSSLPFEELCNNRHSVREFSEQPVSLADLTHVFELAMRAPSVCNRQPSRIYCIQDMILIKKALEIQGGVNGYPCPPALLLVTADITALMNPNEINEGYIDGGIFAMNLLYALESQGFAACPLNTMFAIPTDKTTRELLDIPDDEVFIAYIEVGHYPNNLQFPVSNRLAVSQVLKLR